MNTVLYLCINGFISHVHKPNSHKMHRL